MRTAATLLAALAIACASGAQAQQLIQQQTCAPREVIVRRLQLGYGETQRAIGMLTDQAVAELFISDEKGTWTFLITTSQLMTCMMAAGSSWEPVEAKPLPKGKPL